MSNSSNYSIYFSLEKLQISFLFLKHMYLMKDLHNIFTLFHLNKMCLQC